MAGGDGKEHAGQTCQAFACNASAAAPCQDSQSQTRSDRSWGCRGRPCSPRSFREPGYRGEDVQVGRPGGTVRQVVPVAPKTSMRSQTVEATDNGA